MALAASPLAKNTSYLAELEETSTAEVIRRAGERELSAHPEVNGGGRVWHLPEPRALGIREGVSVEDWPLLANEVDPKRRTGK